MSTNHTPNYNLSQWEPEDKVVRTDFNADNAKIDAAIKAQADGQAALQSAVSALQTALPKKQDSSGAVKLAAGYYAGDGTEGRVIKLSFTPKAVLVMHVFSALYHDNGNSYLLYGGLAVTGAPVKLSTIEAVSIQTGGFQVTSKVSSPYYVYTNRSGHSYRYLAIG